MKQKEKRKRIVKWSSVLSVTDISVRQTKDFVYCMLSTSFDIPVCCKEKLAQQLSLYREYKMRGYVNFRRGGSYLVLETVERMDIDKDAGRLQLNAEPADLELA